MKNKKGAMELGINAIVILIIALVILGLAIGFVTKLLNKGSGELETLIGKEKLKIHASSDDPLVFDPPEVTVKAKKEMTFTVVVYNKMNDKADVQLELTTCIDNEGKEVSGLELVSLAHSIESGEEAGFMSKVVAGKVNSGKYICAITANLDAAGATESYEQQLFITVSS